MPLLLHLVIPHPRCHTLSTSSPINFPSSLSLAIIVILVIPHTCHPSTHLCPLLSLILIVVSCPCPLCFSTRSQLATPPLQHPPYCDHQISFDCCIQCQSQPGLCCLIIIVIAPHHPTLSPTRCWRCSQTLLLLFSQRSQTASALPGISSTLPPCKEGIQLCHHHHHHCCFFSVSSLSLWLSSSFDIAAKIPPLSARNASNHKVGCCVKKRDCLCCRCPHRHNHHLFGCCCCYGSWSLSSPLSLMS